MKNLNILFLLIFLCFIFNNATLNAQVPQLINYQGKITDGQGNPLNGTFSILFSIYDQESVGNLLWFQTHPTVNVTDGVFQVLLGGTLDPFNDLFEQPGDRFLAVKVGNYDEMTPRFRLTSTAYSIRAYSAVKADSVSDGAVVKSINSLKDDVQLVQGANVTITPSGNTLTIAASGGDLTGVTAGNGLTGGGTTGDITLNVGNGTGISVAADAISLNTTYTDGQYVNEGQANSVTSTMITNNAVGSSEIAAGAVTAAHVAGSEVVKTINTLTDDVTLAEGTNITITPAGNTLTIAATGVGTGDITGVVAGDGLTGGGSSGEVTLDVVGGTGISVDANTVSINTTYTDAQYVNEGQANSVTNTMIANNAVTSSEIASDAVDSDEIADGAIAATHIANNEVIKSINTIKDSIRLEAGNNISITPSGHTLTIASIGATGDITGVTAGNGITGGGSSGDVTLDIGEGTGINVGVNAVALNTVYTDSQYVNENQANSVSNSMLISEPGFAYNVFSDFNLASLTTNQTVGSVTITAPADGWVIANAQGIIHIDHDGSENDIIYINILTNQNATVNSTGASVFVVNQQSPTYWLNRGTFSSQNMFPVTSGQALNIYLVIQQQSGTNIDQTWIDKATLKAVFYATQY